MRRKSILTVGIFSFFLISACATDTQDLIEQAQLTDDWTAVNQRVAALERLEPQHPQSCPRGTRKYCVRRMAQEKCSCIENADFRDILESFDW
jgi:hypothetical protein